LTRIIWRHWLTLFLEMVRLGLILILQLKHCQHRHRVRLFLMCLATPWPKLSALLNQAARLFTLHLRIRPTIFPLFIMALGLHSARLNCPNRLLAHNAEMAAHCVPVGTVTMLLYLLPMVAVRNV
jgi:hypothetical protein